MEYSSPTKFNLSRSVWLIPLIIFVVALFVRLIGLDFSFPLLTHHDEQYIVDPLIEMSKRHSLDSGHYNRPNQILYTVLFGYFNLLSKMVFGKNMGLAYPENPLFFYYQGRFVVATFGALIPVFAWYIGKSFKNIDFSLPAAFLTFFYPPFILHSHYITPDILNTFFSLGIILFCLLYLAQKRKTWLIVASVLVAMNTLEKYPGVLSFGIIFFTLVIEAFFCKRQDVPNIWIFFLRRIGLSFTIVIISMVVIAPHLFLKWEQIREILILESRSNHLGADGLSWTGNMLFYLREFLLQGGWLTSLLVLVGIAYSVALQQPEMILLYFGVGYWVALSKLGLHWERWSLPMMISPLLLASLAIAQLWKALPHIKPVKWVATTIFAALALIYALNGFTSSVVLNWLDTRVVALKYLEEQNITPENSVSEGYTPFFPRLAYRVRAIASK